ncbi:MAG: sigma-70 family RNA polymerase sigma factor [Acidobacteria bacterium]|nr:sigma-70 family RNA polymerase sigma factor [Acidobacteriota bacterium]
MANNAAELELHRVALKGHCYRMLGSPFDAEDAVQETMVRAWKALDRFEGRASMRTWLFRIATNVCLDTLAERERRVRPREDGPAGTVDSPLDARPQEHWIEPIPDNHAIPGDASPFEQVALRQSIRLAFVAALQHLPPKQRAALLLTDVLGCSAAEAAECLETSVAAVNSAIQRARATLADRHAGLSSSMPLADDETVLLNRYLEAFHKYDVEAMVALLREDAVLSMPPFTLWLQGRNTISTWLAGRGSGCRGSRLVPVVACGGPAYAQYRLTGPGEGYHAWSLTVLEFEGGQISALNAFLDVEGLFPLFGLPVRLAA